jgi:hypothetical protein
VASKEANESQKHVRTADTRKLRGNATVRRLACSVAWQLSVLVLQELRCNRVAISSICAAQFSSTCSTQSDNSSRRLWLRCSCQFPWSALALLRTCTATAATHTRMSHHWFSAGSTVLVPVNETALYRDRTNIYCSRRSFYKRLCLTS